MERSELLLSLSFRTFGAVAAVEFAGDWAKTWQKNFKNLSKKTCNRIESVLHCEIAEVYQRKTHRGNVDTHAESSRRLRLPRRNIPANIIYLF